MKKESKNKTKKYNKDNIFSPRNILIAFIIIIILLLIFNYFYPVFSFYSYSFNPNSNQGNLYQLNDPPQPEISPEYKEDKCKNVNCFGDCRVCNPETGKCESKPNGQSCTIWINLNPIYIPPIWKGYPGGCLNGMCKLEKSVLKGSG